MWSIRGLAFKAPALGLMLTRFLFFFFFGLLISSACASDLAREHRIADELSDAVVEGESVFLEAADARFWNIYTEAEEPAKGAVIVLHGRGLHPDWPAVARPVRTSLPRLGWSTLSMQLPVLAKGSLFADYVEILPQAGPRIEAGIAHLRSLGYRKIHLVAHSCGAQMTMAWLDNGGGDSLDSLTVVNLGMTKYQRHFGHLPPLDGLKIPVLDIYGGKDFVAKRAAERLQLLNLGANPYSRQQVIAGGKHMLKKQGPELANSINTWLNSLDR